LNPYSVVRHSESTPPTIAASTRPASIIRLAEANTFALDEHADDTVAAGARQIQIAAQEVRYRERIVRLSIAEVRGQRAGRRVAPR
jgi:hypothetical protein